MSPSAPIPVVVCGKSIAVGRGVIEGLKPEYEVIYFITTPSQGKTALPLLLKGEAPTVPYEDINIGSRDFTRVPVAIIVGHNFSDEDLHALMAECSGVEGDKKKGGRSVLWLRPDKTKPRPGFGGPEFIEAVVKNVELCLGGLDLEKEGKGVEGGKVVYY